MRLNQIPSFRSKKTETSAHPAAPAKKGESSGTAKPAGEGSSHVAALRAEAGAHGGPSHSQQAEGTKPVYLYKKELNEARPALKQELKAERDKATRLQSEMKSLGKEINQLKASRDKDLARVLNGKGRTADDVHARDARLSTKETEFSQKSQELRDTKHNLQQLETKRTAIKADLENIKETTRPAFQKPIVTGEKGECPGFSRLSNASVQTPFPPNPDRVAYKAEKAQYQGMDATDRAHFTRGMKDPVVGPNIGRDQVEAAKTPPVSRPPDPQVRTPYQGNPDKTFDSVVDADGFRRPGTPEAASSHVPSPRASSTHDTSSVLSSEDGAKSRYAYKQDIREVRPELRKRLKQQQTKAARLDQERKDLGKAIAQKEKDIQQASAKVLGKGKAPQGASLADHEAELQNLKGQMAAKEREFAQTKSRIGDVENLRSTVKTDLANIKEDAALRFQQPITLGPKGEFPGFSRLAGASLQSPIAPNPGRAEFNREKAEYKQMTPQQRADLDGHDPKTGPNPARDVLEGKLKGPAGDTRTYAEKQAARKEANEAFDAMSPADRARYSRNGDVVDGMIEVPNREPGIGPRNFDRMVGPDGRPHLPLSAQDQAHFAGFDSSIVTSTTRPPTQAPRAQPRMETIQEDRLEAPPT